MKLFLSTGPLVGPSDANGSCPAPSYKYLEAGVDHCCCGNDCCWNKCTRAAKKLIDRNEPGKLNRCLPPGVGAAWKINETFNYFQVKIVTGEKLYDVLGL